VLPEIKEAATILARVGGIARAEASETEQALMTQRVETEQALMAPRAKPSKHQPKPTQNRASISKHAKILGKLGGRPKKEIWQNFISPSTALQ